ncbi:RTA1 like protein-domain-containing protein [Lasiosphaeria miniovina]|uniref:RTA1 like protein-domain-containing protein n=1 Tax=Lasiosphaeria miniovina TaxID=1954250 RepID=A0AA40E413_9PEZI|nr:RTA1 like protein-domain-containing protein [Lasiosphaeria miniovina]KAK0721773.1 RTA1 like protein-domain-containing protein [Lasiosphaeria miniovina]
MYLLARQDTAAQEQNPFKLYHYDPTIAGAVVMLLLFLGTTILHFWQLVRARCWFILPLAIGGILEFIGYAARCKSGFESPDWTLGPYIIQAILLLVAPSLFAATIYMQLGRIIVLLHGESRALIRKQWLTKIFVTGDVLSFVLQGGGGGYQAAGTLDALNNGSKVIIGGLFVQLIFFGIFIAVAVAFDLSIRKNPTQQSGTHAVWRKHMWAMYIGSALIMVRSAFRVIEYLQGFNGYLLSHEAYLYIFDAVLMFLVMALFNYVHPSEVVALIVQDEREYKMGALTQNIHHHERLHSDYP